MPFSTRLHGHLAFPSLLEERPILSEIVHRSSRQSVYLEGSGPLFGLFCSSRMTLLLKWELWMILFRAEAILASSTSKSGIRILRIDDEDLNC